MDFEDLQIERLRCRLSSKWRHYGDECLPAWVAEMDFPIAEPIRAVLTRALEHDDFGYPEPYETIGVGEQFATRMRERHAWSIDPARVEILSDVVQGIYITLLACSQPGAGVLVQTPIYPPFIQSVRSLGRRLVACPLVDDGTRYVIDWEQLGRAAEGVRVLLLCHPHNPTGRVFQRAELERLARLALEHDWVVVSDEIHADLSHPGNAFVPFPSLGPEVAARTVTLSSATKAFNIAGLRCAVAHFGSAELQRRFNACVPPHARGGVGLLGQYCTLAAWQAGEPWLESVRRVLDQNRHFVVDSLRRALPGVRVHVPEATYLAWLDCSALELGESPARFFLEHARVALSDGAWFGSGFERCVRLNFGTSQAILGELVERLARAAIARG